MTKFKLGDRVTVRMPSGVIVPNGKIVAIYPKDSTYKVYWTDTNTHFTVGSKDLLPRF